MTRNCSQENFMRSDRHFVFQNGSNINTTKLLILNLKVISTKSFTLNYSQENFMRSDHHFVFQNGSNINTTKLLILDILKQKTWVIIFTMVFGLNEQKIYFQESSVCSHFVFQNWDKSQYQLVNQYTNQINCKNVILMLLFGRQILATDILNDQKKKNVKILLKLKLSAKHIFIIDNPISSLMKYIVKKNILL